MPTAIKFPLQLAGCALALGVCADLLFYGRMPGVSLLIFVALCLGALAVQSRREGVRPTYANLWLGGGALLFAFFLMLRSEGWLTFLNALACIGLLLLQVGLFRDTPLARLPGYQYVLRACLAIGELSLRPAPLAFSLAGQAVRHGARGERLQRFMPVGRGLVIALPVVGMFTMLLMAADSVFASYVIQVTHFELPIDAQALVTHGILISFVSWVCAGALVTALRPPFLPDPAALPAEGDTRRLSPELARPSWRLGWVEATTVLAAVDLLF
ncbi:MAG TPA: DUF4153 domain-containing protein, partial [Roseiflexaceae bacterium]|nr:DUF4153 domain-containing protein [Roseiflexaceae bacterium]